MNQLINYHKATPSQPRSASASERLRRTSRNLLISLAFLFILTMVNRVLFPCYRQIFAKDLTVEIIATGEHNEQSLYNNARLSTVTCNGTPVNLSQIPLDGNWEYAEAGDFLFNYHTSDPNRLVLQLKNAISTEFTFVSERGSGIVQLIINGEPLNPLDLYSNETWSYQTVRYDTSVFVHPETHPMLFILAFLVIFILIALCSHQLSQKYMVRLFRVCGAVLLQGVLALVLLLCCLFIQYQNPEAMQTSLSSYYLVYLEAYLLILLPMLLLYCLFRSHAISFGVVAAIYEILHLVSGIKQAARGTPLLPWDFQIAGAALSVAESYDLSISPMSLVTLLCSIIILLALFFCRESFPKPHWPCAIAGTGLTAALLAVFLNTTVFCGIWGTTSDSRVYQINNYYAEKGFLVAFTEYTSYLKPQEPPEGYSAEMMEQLSAQIDRTDLPGHPKSETRPNIIAIMSESFWDITALENVTFHADPLPVYRKLTETCMHGDLLSHVFGGNTVISEFEFLTGFHASFFPSDYMVYGSCLGDEFDSAASLLRDQGYHTVAMHPYKATNYNRNTSYQTLGFEQMIFEEDFLIDAQRIRGYVSDSAMFNEVIGLYEQHQLESSEPLFLFGITMQNHGGYWPETLHAPTKVDFTAEGYQDSTFACMEDYFAGIRASDEALGELIRYFSEAEEDTIIIYFGDHMSDAGTKTEKMFSLQSWYDAGGFSTDLRSHRVPYLVWSNCGVRTGEQPIMDISMLLPTVLSDTGLEIPAFWKYLLQQQEYCTAFNRDLAIKPDHAVLNISEASEPMQAYFDTYRLLTYDYVWGKRYAAALWKTS